ncbi:MAG TPA: UDP-N-acetylglucosamine 1-carboxyvinyltransferase [Bacilli bacterium]|nr:UDP-N-acetylglucosamine 1-carboxyvinyltransferase [Bacilli bacterium]
MQKIVIEGNHDLSGEIKISGAKNSAVALIPAAILSDSDVTIFNVPKISDTQTLIEILEELNCRCQFKDNVIKIDSSAAKNVVIKENLSAKLRASYYFMGALLGRFKKVEMYFPGGCKIGSRPIDIHLKGLIKMGATVKIEGTDKYIIEAPKLKGCKIYLDFASVGATINLMLAAVKAEGITCISNAAKEPEIVNVATFLNNMGAKIFGAGTSEIKIIGVSHLGKGVIDVIPDRIEAGTYIIIGALLGKNLKITDVIPTHIESLNSKLREMGVDLQIKENEIIINKCENLKPINIKSLTYPGFPTDLGQPITTLLTQCNGTSFFEETIYENRIGHIEYLNKMGANIKTIKPNAIVYGPTKLKGAEVLATDLRAGAALIIAGLIAEGTTVIDNVEHVLRGYENIAEKLQKVGAKIDLK